MVLHINKNTFKSLLLLVVSITQVVTAGAKVELPSVMGNNMVLQRDTEVNIWGKAKPGTQVTVIPEWNGMVYRTRADKDGRWIVKIATGNAGGPYTLTISDGEPVVLENVLLGEVWICGGQSNMEMQVHGFMHQPTKGGVEAILDAPNHPEMRFFTVGRSISDTPEDDCSGEWLESTPEAVADFSACGYFFGHLLNQMLGVPIGLITANWGGTAAEPWMDVNVFNSLAGIDKDSSLKRVESRPKQKPGVLYNGMIHPIENHTAKGFIWYQGENNRGLHDDYVTILSALIGDWRRKWGDDDMPFYMVQLAPYGYEGAEKMSLPMMIEAQYKIADLVPNVAIAATTDIGNPIGIHPSHKREVGERLAFLALTRDYGMKGLPLPAPTYKSMSVDGNKVTLEFNNLAYNKDWWEGNTFHSYQDDGYIRPKGFEVAGEDRVFYPATGSFGHGNNTIEVYSDSVPHPVAVRYYFHNYVPEANVKTCLGQPLVPFRTDSWPVEMY